MIADARSSSPATQLQGVRNLRKLLWGPEAASFADEILKHNALPEITAFLRSEDDEMKFQAAWFLTNLAASHHTHTAAVIEAVPLLVELLHSANVVVAEQGAWALGNIAGDCAEFRDIVLAAGALGPLVQQLHERAELAMLRTGTWALSNFCRTELKPVTWKAPPLTKVAEAIPVFTKLIRTSRDEEVLYDACYGLKYFSAAPDKHRQAIVDAGACRCLIHLLGHSKRKIADLALLTVGNLAAGTDKHTQAILDAGVLPKLLVLLSKHRSEGTELSKHHSEGMVTALCWILANIMAGTHEQIQAVIDNRAFFIPLLLDQLASGAPAVRKEVAWAFVNAANGGRKDQIAHLRKCGVIEPMCKLLDDFEAPEKLLMALDRMLQVGVSDGNGTNPCTEAMRNAGVVPKLQELQQHADEAVRIKAALLLGTYFPSHDVTSEVLTWQEAFDIVNVRAAELCVAV